MPNSPIQRRADKPLATAVSANKIVRGAVLTTAVSPVTSPTPLPTKNSTSGGGGSGITQLTGDVTAGPGSGSVAATLAAIGSAAGPTGDATHVPVVTIDTKGRVTALSSTAITFPSTNYLVPTSGAKYQRLAKNSATNGDSGWYGPDWFNAKDYGAKGDDSTNDTTALNACLAAAATANGSVFLPDGIYRHTGLSCSLVGSMTIRGTGRFSAVLRCTSASADALVCDLSGGSNKANNRIEIADLGLKTTATTACARGIVVTYGSANIASSENRCGSIVTRVCIEGFNETDTSAGYAFGIVMINAWHAFVTDIYGYGNGTTWNAGATPGAGTSGAGSGALITFLSGTNYTIANIQGDFWSQGIRLAPVSASTAGQNQVCQGVLIDTVNFVQANEGIHCYTNTALAVCDVLSIVNFQVDNGNISGISNLRGIFVEYGVNVYISAGLILQDGGSNALELNNVSGSFVTNVNVSNSNSHNPNTALTLSGASNGNRITACIWNNLPITLGASAGNNFVNNTAGSTTTDSGLGNVVGDPRQLPFVITPTATATYSFTVNISTAGLANRPSGVLAAMMTSLPNDYMAVYDYNNVSNTATTAYMLLSRAGGGTLAAAAIRGCAFVTP